MKHKEISLYQLLAESVPGLHSEIRKLWANSRAYWLVMLMDPQTEATSITPVGPGFPCATLEEAWTLNIEGMVPSAWVRTLHNPFPDGFQQDKESIADTKPQERERWEEQQNAIEAAFEQRKRQLDNLQEELIARESYIAEIEADLAKKAEALMLWEEKIRRRECGN